MEEKSLNANCRISKGMEKMSESSHLLVMDKTYIGYLYVSTVFRVLGIN